MSRPNPGDFRVAAFGDSIMWGQGIRRRQRFTELITNQLAADVGRNPVIAHDRSRSGAQINASSKQREEFLVTFPELFTNRPQRQRFRDGDEGRATQLNGEVPATFPTISWQVDNLTDADGKTIDVALVTGGGNDIDFVSVVNPQKFPGAFIEEYDGAIRRIGHDEVLELLGRVRTKCPNAVILLIGYHKPLSYNSQANEIRALFKKESGYGDLAWWANDTFDFVDVDRMVDEARIRSEWAVGRAQHWMRQAVADACRSRAMRGPGVLFVPVQWDRTGAAFGKGESFVYDDYTHRQPIRCRPRGRRPSRGPTSSTTSTGPTSAFFVRAPTPPARCKPRQSCRRCPVRRTSWKPCSVSSRPARGRLLNARGTTSSRR
jgi:GDSL-like Lipase/Acylhydrolase family